MRNCLLCLHIDGHNVVHPGENNSLHEYDLIKWKRAVAVNLVGGCGVTITDGGGTLKHQQNKSITGSAVWNHTLAKLLAKQSTIYCSNCSHLCFFHRSVCEGQLNASLCPVGGLAVHKTRL